VVSMLATGRLWVQTPAVDCGFLTVIKIRSKISFGAKVKLSILGSNTLRHVKEPYGV
jgi:hypothetical protein